MSWWKDYLAKFADGPATLEAPPSPPTAPPAQQPARVPTSYWSIGDAGHADFDNPDCSIFCWRMGPNGIESQEVLHKDHDHDYLFPGMNRELGYFGRFNQCTGQASLAIPMRRSLYATPPLVIKAIVSQYSKLGLREIWEFRDNTAPLKVWSR